MYLSFLILDINLLNWNQRKTCVKFAKVYYHCIEELKWTEKQRQKQKQKKIHTEATYRNSLITAFPRIQPWSQIEPSFELNPVPNKTPVNLPFQIEKSL